MVHWTISPAPARCRYEPVAFAARNGPPDHFARYAVAAHSVTILFPDWFIEVARDYGVPSPEARMAKNKKWTKVIARIQALENALEGLLSGKSSAKRRKAKKAPAKKPAPKPAKSKRKAPAKKPAQKPRAKKSVAAVPARKPRKRNLRVAVAENAPILPQPPIPSL
jgi:hypothetical protein